MSATTAAEAPGDTPPETGESARAAKPDADSVNSCSADGDKGQASSPPLLPGRCTEALSPPKTPVSASLAESTPSASHSESGKEPTKRAFCVLLCQNDSMCNHSCCNGCNSKGERQKEMQYSYLSDLILFGTFVFTAVSMGTPILDLLVSCVRGRTA